MRFLARTSRCAIVAGSTAYAAAIAAASTPSTACSINGVRIDAAMAGWAHTSIELEAPIGNLGRAVGLVGECALLSRLRPAVCVNR